MNTDLDTDDWNIHMAAENRFGGITRGGFLGLMLVGGLVVGLFFIPELLHVSSKSGPERTATSAGVSDARTESESVKPLASNAGSLDRESAPARTGFSGEQSQGAGSWGWLTDLQEWFGALSSPRLSQNSRERALSRRNAVSAEARASLGNVSQRLDAGRSGEITWAAIRSQESRDAVGQARRDALELSRGIPSAARASKFAMIDFANGLDFVMARAEQQMTPRDAVLYLLKLDQSVNVALEQDKVDRVFLKRWSQVSLGPVLSKTMLGQRHASEILPFDPQLTLTSVRVVHRGMIRGNPNTGKVKVELSGYLIGDDIKSVSMEANDGGITVNLPLKRDPRGFLFFNRGSIDGRQTWRIRVYDKFGERYQKIYRFYPKATGFQYETRAGYKLPFRMVRTKVGTFRSQDYDPRLDKFFAVAGGLDGQPDPNASFVTF